MVSGGTSWAVQNFRMIFGILSRPFAFLASSAAGVCLTSLLKVISGIVGEEASWCGLIVGGD